MTNPGDHPIDDLVRASTPERAAGRTFAWSVPDGWQQGRGAFGGLVLAALTRSVLAVEPDRERHVRSITGEIAGPVRIGEATLAVEPLRLGSAMSTWTATLTQAGDVLARITAILGRDRAIEHAWAPAPPAEALRGWQETEVVPIEPPFGPTFARFLEYRPTGPLPFTCGTEAVAHGWIRPRRVPAALGAPEVVALADAWWPAAAALESGPRPTATVSFTLQHRPTARPLPPDEPLFHRARAVSALHGFLVEFRELWTARGELVALNQQTFVWIR